MKLVVRCLPSERRRGSITAEVIVAAIMLSSVALVLTPALRSVIDHRQVARFETLALVELNNLATQIHSNSSLELSLSDWFQQRYPGARLTVTPDVASDNILAGTRLQIARTDRPGRPDVIRSLVVWSAREGGEP
ncbi:MAG: hypothetical protein KDA81_07120 [Planctomycetaceae bacterium]|nr:hypothetical protein [Planctomycetaceae bacterium]